MPDSSDESTESVLPLTPEDVKNFRDLMRQECGVELSDQEAWDRATVLISLYRMFLGPLPEDPENSALPRVQTSST